MNTFIKMYIKTLLVLTACILANGYDCPEYCRCTESLVTHTQEDKIVRAKCTHIDGLTNPTDMLSNINAIDLSAANLSDVSSNFNNFKVLFEVNLSYNELTKIPKLNNRISNLKLNHNKLTSSSISKLPLHVQYLDLAYNEITIVPKDLMRLNRLRKLNLTGNPIDCSCDSIRVRNWLVKRFIVTDGSVTCTTPKQFENQSWSEFDEIEICELQKIQKNKYFIESDHELMQADEPISRPDLIEGSGSDVELTTSFADPVLPNSDTTIKDMLRPVASSDLPYLLMAKEVMDLLPKKKSADGKTEVYATSGAAGVVIIALTVFAVYKKHSTGGGNIEPGEEGAELKTIGGLELSKATKLVMQIEKDVESTEPLNINNVVNTAEDVEDLAKI